MRRFMFAITLAAAARAGLAQESASLVRCRYDSDGAHSSVGFMSRFLRFARVPGRFTDFDATVIYDSADPGRSSVTAVIRTASLSTDLDTRDAHLKSPDFFDVQRFPQILFRSTRVEPRRGDTLLVTGDLTLHGVTRSVAFPAALVFPRTWSDASGFGRVGFEARLTINRQDFGVAGGNQFNPQITMEDLMVPDSIEINLEMLLVHQGYRHFRFPRLARRSIGDTMLTLIGSRGLPAAIAFYRAARATAADSFLFGEPQLNRLGYLLMDRGRTNEAVEVLRLNAEQFPQSWNVYDSLGEAYGAAGDRDHAIDAYRRTLALRPDNPGAMEMLRRLAP